jgi:hypothetical protein
MLAELQYIFALDMCGEPDETYAPGEPLVTLEKKRKRVGNQKKKDELDTADETTAEPPFKKKAPKKKKKQQQQPQKKKSKVRSVTEVTKSKSVSS